MLKAQEHLRIEKTRQNSILATNLLQYIIWRVHQAKKHDFANKPPIRTQTDNSSIYLLTFESYGAHQYVVNKKHFILKRGVSRKWISIFLKWLLHKFI